MGYHIEIADRDVNYLAALPLSDEAKNRIENFIVNVIGEVSDGDRNHPGRRHPSGGPYFTMSFAILDVWGDGRASSIDFTIKDSSAAYGVLQIVYTIHHGPM